MQCNPFYRHSVMWSTFEKEGFKMKLWRGGRECASKQKCTAQRDKYVLFLVISFGLKIFNVFVIRQDVFVMCHACLLGKNIHRLIYIICERMEHLHTYIYTYIHSHIHTFIHTGKF
jgi:hypothetical protein